MDTLALVGGDLARVWFQIAKVVWNIKNTYADEKYALNIMFTLSDDDNNE